MANEKAAATPRDQLHEQLRQARAELDRRLAAHDQKAENWDHLTPMERHTLIRQVNRSNKSLAAMPVVPLAFDWMSGHRKTTIAGLAIIAAIALAPWGMPDGRVEPPPYVAPTIVPTPTLTPSPPASPAQPPSTPDEAGATPTEERTERPGPDRRPSPQPSPEPPTASPSPPPPPELGEPECLRLLPSPSVDLDRCLDEIVDRLP